MEETDEKYVPGISAYALKFGMLAAETDKSNATPKNAKMKLIVRLRFLLEIALADNRSNLTSPI